ncbi:MAG: hypothetical protein AWU59_457 [Methanolobus sp. T82-4]|jgi:hypothetical protein|nr:MAG: hypothetical protein AWU59_457 [Methanolobus sp. T82-4]
MVDMNDCGDVRVLKVLVLTFLYLTLMFAVVMVAGLTNL